MSNLIEMRSALSATRCGNIASSSFSTYQFNQCIRVFSKRCWNIRQRRIMKESERKREGDSRNRNYILEIPWPSKFGAVSGAKIMVHHITVKPLCKNRLHVCDRFSLTASGEIVSLGLEWAWRVKSGIAPFVYQKWKKKTNQKPLSAKHFAIPSRCAVVCVCLHSQCVSRCAPPLAILTQSFSMKPCYVLCCYMVYNY